MISKIRPWWKLTCVFLALCWFLGRLIVLNQIRGKSVERGFRFRSKFCKAALSILNIEYRFSGIIPEGPCLYVSNHRSMLDPLIQLGYLDTYILSKAEVGNYPVLGRGAKETGIILVERHHAGSRKSALAEIEFLLRSGYPVLIYPEGTTYGGPLTGDFKKGSMEMAHRLQIPIIPVLIEYPNSSYYWVNETLMEYFKRILSMRKTHVVIGRVGTPVEVATTYEITTKTRAQIEAMMIEVRAKRGGQIVRRS